MGKTRHVECEGQCSFFDEYYMLCTVIYNKDGEHYIEIFKGLNIEEIRKFTISKTKTDVVRTKFPNLNMDEEDINLVIMHFDGNALVKTKEHVFTKPIIESWDYGNPKRYNTSYGRVKR